MDLYGQTGRSLPQKAFVIAAELVLLALSWRFLFGAWRGWFSGLMGWPDAADHTRRVVLFAFNLVVFVRMTFMMMVLLRRRMPIDEAVTVPLAFAVYYLGFAVMTLRTARAMDALGWAGVGLFAAGSIVNSGAELQRHLWKRRPENAGHLFTGGLFAWSMHVNYFGDLLWVTGYALVTGNPWAALVPAVLFCFFAFYNAPMLDKHLHEHYGDEFERYAARTKKIIPLVY